MTLSGKHILVTAGPTHEPIDPVRFIANRSSGRQGHAVAAALAAAGAEVTLVSGPVDIPAPPTVRLVEVETAREMQNAVESALPADIAVFAAAVGDWRVEAESAEKIKKNGGAPPELALVENPDILAGVARHPLRPALVIGFAAETENLLASARAKLARKGADWIVANDVSPETGVMGGTRNRVHLITSAGVESWPEMTKAQVADWLVDRIVDAFNGAEAQSAPAGDAPMPSAEAEVGLLLGSALVEREAPDPPAAESEFHHAGWPEHGPELLDPGTIAADSPLAEAEPVERDPAVLDTRPVR